MRGRGTIGACCLVLAALTQAQADTAGPGGAGWYVDLAPCMDIEDGTERSACYDSLASVVRRLRDLEVPAPPVPPAPPAPAAPPEPPDFEGRGVRVLRIQDTVPAAAWRLDGGMGVWVNRRGDANVLLMLEPVP